MLHAHLAMVTEVIDGLKRHSIHCAGTNQFLGIEYVTVGWILRAGASP